MYTYASTPQGIGRILDGGFRLCFSGFRKALLLVGFSVPFFALIIIAFWIALGDSFFNMITIMQNGTKPPGNDLVALFKLLFFFLSFNFVMWFPTLIFSIAIIRLNGTIGEGGSPSLKDCLRAGARKFFPVMIYFILLFLIILASLLPLFITLILLAASGIKLDFSIAILVVTIGFIPSFFFWICLMFGPYLIILDDVGVFDSLSRSFKLVWGLWWRTFGFIIVYMVLVVVEAIIEKLFIYGADYLIKLYPGSYHSITALGLLFQNITSIVFIAFLIPLLITYYHDLKLRKHGGDLAARIEAA